MPHNVNVGEMLRDGYMIDPRPLPDIPYPKDHPRIEGLRDLADTQAGSYLYGPNYSPERVIDIPLASQLPEGSFLLTVATENVIEGDEADLEKFMAQHPLGRDAFGRDEGIFEANSATTLEYPYYQGVGGLLHVPEEDKVLIVERGLYVPSYLNGVVAGIKTYQTTNAIEDGHGVKPKQNTVLPTAMYVGSTYEMPQARGSRGLRHLSRIVSAQEVMPPDYVSVDIKLPTQRDPDHDSDHRGRGSSSF